VDESVMWGDHYFVEALHRITQDVGEVATPADGD
jgi:hypothetical protein